MSPSDNCSALKLAVHLHASHCKRPECIALSDMRELFADLHDYFDNRADVDEPEPGHQIANEAMRLLVRVDHLAQALGVTAAEEVEIAK